MTMAIPATTWIRRVRLNLALFMPIIGSDLKVEQAYTALTMVLTFTLIVQLIWI